MSAPEDRVLDDSVAEHQPEDPQKFQAAISIIKEHFLKSEMELRAARNTIQALTDAFDQLKTGQKTVQEGIGDMINK